MKKHEYLKNVATLTLDKDKCIGCKMCIQVCPHEVFTMKDSRAEIIDKDSCMECGACAKNCPAEAISVQSGVGCAFAILNGMLRGGEPDCSCSKNTKKSCC